MEQRSKLRKQPPCGRVQVPLRTSRRALHHQQQQQAGGDDDPDAAGGAGAQQTDYSSTFLPKNLSPDRLVYHLGNRIIQQGYNVPHKVVFQMYTDEDELSDEGPDTHPAYLQRREQERRWRQQRQQFFAAVVGGGQRFAMGAAAAAAAPPPAVQQRPAAAAAAAAGRDWAGLLMALGAPQPPQQPQQPHSRQHLVLIEDHHHLMRLPTVYCF